MRRLVVTVAWIGAVALALLALQTIAASPGAACRETDPITSFFEPSQRGPVDPEACAQVREAAATQSRRLGLGAATLVIIGIGGLAFGRKPLEPSYDRGFQRS
ncbi:MAG: hypothetical protein H0V17_28035 [Deltaproteobacteria bacterium]|nr:hypothetical protein [Deltaproteobacteria bacterium]